MSIDPKTLFTGLHDGDLLMSPVELPSSKESTTFFSAVLRVGSAGELWLSVPEEHRVTPTAYAGCNPFRWSDQKGALIDCHGDVPRWYSVDVSLERGGAKWAAAQYATVPRAEHLRHQVQPDDFDAFIKSDPRYLQLCHIVRNGEAGTPLDQLSLVMDLLGLAHTKEQLIGLGCFLEHVSARQTVVIALANLAKENATKPPTK